MIHIKKNSFSTSSWSGGTTTELYIFPSGSDFKKGNFDIRLSTATVEVNESTFTSLPEVDRTLMVLAGEMRLEHEGFHSTDLQPFDQDKFRGEWISKSFGKCVDLNLMCQNETIGRLKPVSIIKNSDEQVILDGDLNFVYLYDGAIECQGKNLNSGDLFVLKGANKINLTAWHASELVIVEVFGVNVEEE